MNRLARLLLSARKLLGNAEMGCLRGRGMWAGMHSCMQPDRSHGCHPTSRTSPSVRETPVTGIVSYAYYRDPALIALTLQMSASGYG